MHGFAAAEAKAAGQAPGCGLYQADGTPLESPSAVAFASLVRELDLGERYQQHLDSYLATPQSKALLADSVRHGMLIDAMQAHHAGVLDEAELELLVKLWRDGWLSQLNDTRVLGKRLEVLGCPLQQIVVLDVRDETFAPLHTSTRRVLVHIPGDPHGAWSAHDDLQQFARRVLGQRLRMASYRQFFARFVRARDSQAFFSHIEAGYDDLTTWANIDLHERMQPMGLMCSNTSRHCALLRSRMMPRCSRPCREAGPAGPAGVRATPEGAGADRSERCQSLPARTGDRAGGHACLEMAG